MKCLQQNQRVMDVHLTYHWTIGQQVFGNKASLASGSFPDALYLKQWWMLHTYRAHGESLVNLEFSR